MVLVIWVTRVVFGPAKPAGCCRSRGGEEW